MIPFSYETQGLVRVCLFYDAIFHRLCLFVSRGVWGGGVQYGKVMLSNYINNEHLSVLFFVNLCCINRSRRLIAVKVEKGEEKKRKVRIGF
jgi:hypothetical protein